MATDIARPAARLHWRTVHIEAAERLGRRGKRLDLKVAGWPGHVPGQHVDIRLTAADGYQVQRSYSIASAPHMPGVTLAVEYVTDGEVSPYLTIDAQVGDVFELRGPIGGYFVWDAAVGRPLLLCAGGSGIAPFMAMLEHRARVAPGLPTTLLYSARSAEDAMFATRIGELAHADPALRVVWTYTRAAPDGWRGYARRIDASMLRETVPSAHTHAHIYVCGPTVFVESVATTLVELGHSPESIRTERFGPSGTS